jgi:hypothetical protein
MLELGRFRVVRTADLADTIYDGKGRELQGCTLVVSRYAGIAVFQGLIMALTFDPCKPLKTRGCGRGSQLTSCETEKRRRGRGHGHYSSASIIYNLISADTRGNPTCRSAANATVPPYMRLATRKFRYAFNVVLSIKASLIDN